MKPVFFIDLDDTLMPNQHYYKIQQAKMLKYMVGVLWPPGESLTEPGNPYHLSRRKRRQLRRTAKELLDEVYDYGYRVPPLFELLESEVVDETGLLEDILRKEEELDLKGVERYRKVGEPYHRERFPTSCRDTYYYFCEQMGVDPDEEVADEIYRIGEGFWKTITPGLMWGAARILDYLSERDHDLHVLTKGDEIVQGHKLRINRMERWIPEENWHIVSDKDPEVFRRVTSGLDLERVYMIGNSQRSDINPAIEAGANAIYIPFYTWAHEESLDFSVTVEERYALERRGELLLLENGRRVFVLPHIKDILDIYEEL